MNLWNEMNLSLQAWSVLTNPDIIIIIPLILSKKTSVSHIVVLCGIGK